MRDGLVTRVRSKDDRRYLLVSLTEEGRARHQEAQKAHYQSVIDRFSFLSDDEQAQFHGLLSKLEAALQEQLETDDEER